MGQAHERSVQVKRRQLARAGRKFFDACGGEQRDQHGLNLDNHWTIKLR